MNHIFITTDGFTTVFGDYNSSVVASNLGRTEEDFLNGKYILLDEEMQEFFEANPSATPTEIFYKTMSDEISEGFKQSLIEAIKAYDKSDNVNIFYVNDNPLWINAESRVKLLNAVSLEKEAGATSTTLWLNNIPYKVPVDEAISMIKDIEHYAIVCNDVTMLHIYKVNKATIKSELNELNITIGYPNKLHFNLEPINI